MAEYPKQTVNRSPFFKTFTNSGRRPGNIVNRQRALENMPGLPVVQEAMSTQINWSAVQQASVPKSPQMLEPIEPPAPEDAAQRFRQVNRGLPDGVRFEPLDDETKAALERLGKIQEEAVEEEVREEVREAKAIAPPRAPVPQPVPTPPVLVSQESTKSAEVLERLIQDERNASIYYQGLSGIAPAEDMQASLQAIAKDCEAWRGQYQQILQKLHEKTFEPKNTTINVTVQFDRGVEMAASEERKILESMAELIDHLEDRDSAKVMQNLINKRMIRLSWLQSI